MRNTLAIAIAAAALAGCPSKKTDPVAAKDAAAPVIAIENEPVANAAHGKELVLQFQCNRCHDGTGHPAAEDGKHCVHCHENIMTDRFKAAPASIARWKPRVKELQFAPSLEATGARFSRTWVESYLLQPADLRPHLHQYMPRLAITREDARDIAAYLVPDAKEPKAEPLKADLGKGRQLLETKGCGSCHVMTGVAALPPSAPPAMENFEKAHRLAPDLRFARDRMSATKMQAWLADPKAVKPDTLMPKIALTPEEIKDITGYLLEAEVKPPPKPARFARLPVLDRKVTFKEVDEKVFHRTCWHCHSEPDFAIGDGGPGNSGGLGFKPRGLNLSDYAGIIAGDVDDKGERQSIFAKDDKGVPRIVAALVARHDEEEQGAETGKVRGMPLGYDALSAEEIQLVETWASQGRPK
ncbi:MAG: c-type cytochrome [Labilithrix sp.]|nr:c-type cytochrome [Labilithrix sp.]MCW5814651.1 c-type cytochrome [Labilithrix sp.]